MPSALITGVTGQDGSYLTELLLSKGYTVHGLVRRASMFNRSRIEHLRSDASIYNRTLFLHYADLSDATTLRRLFLRLKPDELYHLAGQSHVGLSFEIPESTVQDAALSCLTLLEICRDLAYPIRFYHASTSEIFGATEQAPQRETTPMRPMSPYGCAKAFATQICRVYREAYGIHVSSGIAFNHESPRRGENFVTRKIVRGAVQARKRLSSSPLRLGNLSATRDWGYAPEYVEAMWKMLQQESPADLVLATGRECSVRDFARAAFAAAGFHLKFEGEGAQEAGLDSQTGTVLLKVDPVFFRPLEPHRLVGDPRVAKEQIGWEAKTTALDLAARMVREETESD